VAVELSGSPRLQRLLSSSWGDYFKGEVLAEELHTDRDLDGGDDARTLEVDGEELRVQVKPVGSSGLTGTE
jgi:hypothetical protein